jgi:hypothetical protein
MTPTAGKKTTSNKACNFFRIDQWAMIVSFFRYIAPEAPQYAGLMPRVLVTSGP